MTRMGADGTAGCNNFRGSIPSPYLPLSTLAAILPGKTAMTRGPVRFATRSQKGTITLYIPPACPGASPHLLPIFLFPVYSTPLGFLQSASADSRLQHALVRCHGPLCSAGHFCVIWSQRRFRQAVVRREPEANHLVIRELNPKQPIHYSKWSIASDNPVVLPSLDRQVPVSSGVEVRKYLFPALSQRKFRAEIKQLFPRDSGGLLVDDERAK